MCKPLPQLSFAVHVRARPTSQLVFRCLSHIHGGWDACKGVCTWGGVHLGAVVVGRWGYMHVWGRGHAGDHVHMCRGAGVHAGGCTCVGVGGMRGPARTCAGRGVHGQGRMCIAFWEFRHMCAFACTHALGTQSGKGHCCNWRSPWAGGSGPALGLSGPPTTLLKDLHGHLTTISVRIEGGLSEMNMSLYLMTFMTCNCKGETPLWLWVKVYLNCSFFLSKLFLICSSCIIQMHHFERLLPLLLLLFK